MFPLVLQDLLPGLGTRFNHVHARDLHEHCGLGHKFRPALLHPGNILPEDLVIRVDSDGPLDLETALVPPP